MVRALDKGAEGVRLKPVSQTDCNGYAVFDPGTYAGKKIIVLLLVALMAAATVAVLPRHAYADQTINMWDGESIAYIESEIQVAIDVAHAGGAGTITVTGDNHRLTGSIHLFIPSDITVIWRADLVIDSPDNGALLLLEGAGVFEIIEGANLGTTAANSITVSTLPDNTNLKIRISGGMVTAGGDNSIAIRSFDSSIFISGGQIATSGSNGTAVYSEESGVMFSATGVINSWGSESCGVFLNSGSITVSGGAIHTQAENSFCIKTNTGGITITDGSLTASGSGSTVVAGISSSIKISGGLIEASAKYSSAAYTTGGLIDVSGGFISVSSDESAALSTDSAAIVVSGGKIIAGRTSSRTIFVQDSGVAVYLAKTTSGSAGIADEASGIIVKVDSLATSGFANGTTDGLTVVASGNESYRFFWELSGSSALIVFLSQNDSGATRHEVIWHDPEFSPKPAVNNPSDDVSSSEGSSLIAFFTDDTVFLVVVAVVFLILAAIMLTVRHKVNKRPLK